MILIWGMELIDKYFKEMVSGKILHLDGCHGQIAKQKSNPNVKDLLKYEIIIQPGSTVESKGFHTHTVKVSTMIPTIDFIDIFKITNEFRIRAYIKTIFTEAHNAEGPRGFGSGSITEGIHKVPVQIQSFKESDFDQFKKGSCIMLKGIVKRSGKVTIMCRNASYIELLSDEPPMSMEEVSNANKTLKRWSPSIDDEQT